MSNDKKLTWSGDPADFDKAYEWAGQANLMEERGNKGDGDQPATEHKLHAYNPGAGWVEVKAGDTLVKDDEGYLSVEVVAEPVAEAEETPAETPVEDPAKETKDSPVVGGIETKPAVVEPAKPAKATSK